MYFTISIRRVPLTRTESHFHFLRKLKNVYLRIKPRAMCSVKWLCFLKRVTFQMQMYTCWCSARLKTFPKLYWEKRVVFKGPAPSPCVLDPELFSVPIGQNGSDDRHRGDHDNDRLLYLLLSAWRKLKQSSCQFARLRSCLVSSMSISRLYDKVKNAQYMSCDFTNVILHPYHREVFFSSSSSFLLCFFFFYCWLHPKNLTPQEVQ